MSHKRALYAGSFDPFTMGHYDIVQRALQIVDDLTIVLAKSPIKNPLFSVQERLQMLRKLFNNNSQVKVVSWEGLIVDFARKEQIGTIIRGLRPTGDFESEFQMAAMNKQLYDEIETIFLMTSAKYYFISSSLVKEVYLHRGDIKQFVPPIILEQLEKQRA